MMKKIACFAATLALVAASAFAEKARTEKDGEAQVRQDRRDAEHRDEKKLSAAARSDLEKTHARLHRDERDLRKDTEEPAKEKRQLRQ